MANTTKARGLDPIWHGSTPPLTALATTLTNGTYNYFINSAVYLGGSGLATTGTTGGTVTVSGAVVMLYDSTGAPAHNVAKASATGCAAEYTCSPDQRFLCTAASTDVDATPGDLGADLDAEGATVGVAGFSLSNTMVGSHFSDRQLTAASSTRSGLPLWIVSASPLMFGNDAATAGFECIVTINPAKFL